MRIMVLLQLIILNQAYLEWFFQVSSEDGWNNFFPFGMNILEFSVGCQKPRIFELGHKAKIGKKLFLLKNMDFVSFEKNARIIRQIFHILTM